MSNANNTGPPYISRYPADWQPFIGASPVGSSFGTSGWGSSHTPAGRTEDETARIRSYERTLRARLELVLSCLLAERPSASDLCEASEVLGRVQNQLVFQREALSESSGNYVRPIVSEEPPTSIGFHPVGDQSPETIAGWSQLISDSYDRKAEVRDINRGLFDDSRSEGGDT